MKKVFLTIAAALLLCNAAFGQTEINQKESTSTTTMSEQREMTADLVRTNNFGKNWEISIGAGTQFYLGENDRYAKFFDNLTPAIDIWATKWASPSIGFNFGITGFQMKGLNHTYSGSDVEFGYYLTHQPYQTNDGPCPPYFRQNGYFFNVFIGLQANLINIIGGYKPNRFYNLELAADGGFAYGFDPDQGYNHCGATFHAAIINRFRVSEMVDIMLNIRGNLISDDFDGECGINETNYAAKASNRGLDGIGGVTVGAVIKFPYNTKNGPQPALWVNAVDESVVKDYQTTISDLEKSLKESQDEAAKVKAERDALAARPVPAPVIVEKPVNVPLWFHINFTIDRYDLLLRERINLRSVADIMKSNPDAKYCVVGYCDVQTASREYNDALSERRSKAVADYLVEKCGVNRDQLIIDHKGGVDYMYFNKPEYSRCVLIYSADSEPGKADFTE